VWMRVEFGGGEGFGGRGRGLGVREGLGGGGEVLGLPPLAWMWVCR